VLHFRVEFSIYIFDNGSVACYTSEIGKEARIMKEKEVFFTAIGLAIAVVIGLFAFFALSNDEKVKRFVSTDGIKSVEYITKEDLPER